MKTSDPLISKDDHALEHNLSKSSGKDKVNSPRKVPHLEEGTLLQRVSFRTDNFVENFRGCIEKYDTVICLSVTKWIHLNWGDDGLVTLFAKIWRLLRQGGILLLEPQSWSSYRSNRLVSEIAKLNFNNIMFTPDLFQEILLDKIGFRSMMDVSGPLSGTVAGFHRPIFLFQK
uniref:RNA methyltransferase n=1 Tax=Anthurium amnicola TaxID=1678845 RepID=A0A1D1Y5Z3_9ARAE